MMGVNQVTTSQQGGDESKIGADEVEQHLIWIKQALDSHTPGERRTVLIEGLLRFGLRFGYTLAYLADAAKHEDSYQTLYEEYIDVLGTWLTGRHMTDRADEDERRARVAMSIIRSPRLAAGLERLAARSILALPEGHNLRDVDAAHQALLRHLKRMVDQGDIDGQVNTISTLIEYGLESQGRTQELIAQAQKQLDPVSDTDVRHDFVVTVLGYYSQLAIAERDAGNNAAQQRWLVEAEDWLERLKAEPVDSSETSRKKLLVVALHLELSEKPEKAADTYALARGSDEPSDDGAILAAHHEGRLRLSLRQYVRAVAVLSPIVPVFEERYLTAVEDSKVESAGEYFSKVLTNLAFAHAYLHHWDEAIGTLDRAKSLRLRYSAALRATPSGRKLLHLEAKLYALTRGVVPEDAETEDERNADWIGAEVSLQTRILEEYREQRPNLAPELLASPSTGEIAATLAGDEAVVILGISFVGTLVTVIRRGDREMPSGRLLLTEWPLSRLVAIFAGEHEDGWLYALGAPEAGLDYRKALTDLLAALDEGIGASIKALLTDRLVRRTTIIPHRWLHLVPFWALPSLSDYQVATSPSAAHFVRTHRHANMAERKVLAVADPTLDLPLSPAELAALSQHLGTTGWDVTQLCREQATEDTLASTLPDASVFHFCGHGRSNLTQPSRSALFMHPDMDRFQDLGSEPFRSLLSHVQAWHASGDDERYADVPGRGRLYEQGSPETGVLERRLEYSERGTLWGQYEGENLIQLAELWTAGDMMVQDSLSKCKLAFLSACETGNTGLEVDIDEYSGLSAALQLIGVSTVICSLWPVSDELTALYVDLFYAAFVQAPQPVDLAMIVQSVAKRLRTMPKGEAAAMLDDLRRRTSDPRARFRLEARADVIAEGEEYPFSHSYDWAAFYVTGNNELRIEEEVAHAQS
jgi:CHAT domain-containing protein